ncbi:MAG TPA: SDR family oxidoreductase [Alphaproteobacteria bacterium]|nr:SDR family oxidoreductase [Alphaproteobacteria bacterium]
MADRLKGKAAIVTGGAGGIGAAVGRLFCEEGARVALVDRDAAAMGAALEDIRSSVPGAQLLGIVADVAREAEAGRVIVEATAALGSLDVLVNNAGIRLYHKLSEAPTQSWQDILGVNLLGYAHMAKAALPALRASGKASIVNISSTYGVTGRPGMGQYDATKAAILALTRTLAFEEAAHGVRVNAVCPGFTLTPFHVRRAKADGRAIEDLRREAEQSCIMRRWAEPREIACPILWLASDEASYVTAATFMIDGGRPLA